MKDEFEKWLESQWDDENDDSIMVSCGKQEMLREVFAKYRSIRASAVAVEPLAVLADRKGVSVEITPPSFYQTEGEGWDIGVAVPWEGILYPFDSPTYAECEAKARAYLNGLEDRKGGE
jgi:hypothetical protein